MPLVTAHACRHPYAWPPFPSALAVATSGDVPAEVPGPWFVGHSSVCPCSPTSSGVQCACCPSPFLGGRKCPAVGVDLQVLSWVVGCYCRPFWGWLQVHAGGGGLPEVRGWVEMTPAFTSGHPDASTLSSGLCPVRHPAAISHGPLRTGRCWGCGAGSGREPACRQPCVSVIFGFVFFFFFPFSILSLFFILLCFV